MMTSEILTVMETDLNVEMHSKGSIAENDLPNINNSLCYIDSNSLDSLNNTELAKSIANSVKGNGANTTESIVITGNPG